MALISFALGIISLVLSSMSGCKQANTPPKQTVASEPVKVALSKKDLFDLKARCAEMGRTYANQLAKDINTARITVGGSRFAYNETLNTCLYSGRIIVAPRGPLDVGTTQGLIVDLLSGEQLVASNNPTEFEERDVELLGPKQAISK